ncbi:ABC transporter ATP-binding protein [Salinisphaera aquimarina]|uniref:ABC transporter ATP-binding protein n=1 Tax=Salinisphaera aquimarina TaxID=2094031 RepID=A0ABV7ESJ8_9GAMM
MSALAIRNVHKRFGDTTVLEDINLEVDEGDFLILVGPSGCGKSTLLNMLAGLEPLTEGEILLNGQRINDRSPRDRNIAMVFQFYALYPNMSVRRNIRFGLQMRKVPRAQQAEIVRNVARILQIEPLLDRKPAQLSGGQRQRVAIGRALARDPALFLFDEPLSNLDAKLRVEMRTEIKLLHQRLGTAMVYVTHDQIEAMTLGNRIAVMNEGRIQQLGSPQDIYDNPVNRYVAGFIGSPAMNFIPCDLVGENGALSLSLSGAGGPAHLPLPEALRARLGAQNKTRVVLGVRPEHVTPAGPSHDSAVDCTVRVVEPTGPDTYVFTQVNEVEVIARCTPGQAPAPEETLALNFDLSRAVFFDPDSDARLA